MQSKQEVNEKIIQILENELICNHQLNRYLKFLDRCLNRPCIEGEYSEGHHILPKSLFPEYKKEEWNLIKLNGREHFIAHWILSKVFTDRKKYACIRAFHFMTVDSRGTRYNSKSYSYSRKLLSQAMREDNPMKSEETRKKTAASIQSYWTPDRRKEYGLKRLGKPSLTDAGKERLSKLWAGVKRPKTKEQIDRNRKSSSCGLFKTPFGEFYSPGDAFRSPLNIGNLSRHLINKFCRETKDGFSFISFGKVENRGTYKRITPEIQT